jgi:NADH-quinone oxidoreductase subunit I
MAIKIVPRYGSSFRDKLYIPAIAGGMKTTFKHFFKNLRDVEGVSTLQYPEVQPSDITERYRGVHRLTKHDDGTEKCVACFMCATACPAECIFIEAEERFDGVDEKRPRKGYAAPEHPYGRVHHQYGLYHLRTVSACRIGCLYQ